MSSPSLSLKNASLKNRLEHSNREIDRLGDQTSKFDKESRSDKESLMLEKFQLEKDLSIVQNQLKVSYKTFHIQCVH